MRTMTVDFGVLFDRRNRSRKRDRSVFACVGGDTKSGQIVRMIGVGLRSFGRELGLGLVPLIDEAAEVVAVDLDGAC